MQANKLDGKNSACSILNSWGKKCPISQFPDPMEIREGLISITLYISCVSQRLREN
jgi:hypothetical protein